MEHPLIAPSEKTCTKCKISKTFENYHAKPAGKYGLHSICRSCRSSQATAWTKANGDRSREIQRDAKRRIRETDEGRRHLSRINGEYVRRNKERVNAYWKNRKQTDSLYAMKVRYRALVTKAFTRRGFRKDGRSLEILGCSWAELMSHIELQFTDGMNWERFFAGEIHIDHRIPLATVRDEEDAKALSHYTNLQPLWAFENLSKGARMPDIHMMGSGNVRTDI